MLVVKVCVVCFGCAVSYEMIQCALCSLVTRFTLCSLFASCLLRFTFFHLLLSSSFPHPLLCYFCPILLSAPLFTLAFSFSPLLFSSPLTSSLSLLISHSLALPRLSDQPSV